MPSALLTEPEQLIVHHSPLLDVCTSRNVAAQAVETEWVCFLDADDELDSNFVNAVRPYLGLRDVILAPYASYVSENGVKAPPLIPNAGDWPSTNDTVSGAVIRSSDLDRLGGWNQEFWPWSDWELWLRAARAGIRRIHLPQAVYVVHESAGSENTKLSPGEALRLYRKVKSLHRQVWEA